MSSEDKNLRWLERLTDLIMHPACLVGVLLAEVAAGALAIYLVVRVFLPWAKQVLILNGVRLP